MPWSRGSWLRAKTALVFTSGPGSSSMALEMAATALLAGRGPRQAAVDGSLRFVRVAGGNLVLSATDLSSFLSCRHRTALEMGEARGKRRRPWRNDPLLELLFQRGLAHEKAYVESLRAAARDVVDLAELREPDVAIARTLELMRSGADVIVQAAVGDGRWYGRPDVMHRVDGRSALGAWSYEVTDTKLARETRAGTVLQLGLYSELLGVAQGAQPERFHVVTPDPEAPVRSYRTDEYAAYLRWIRAQLDETVAQDDAVVAAAHYPWPVEHCDVCPWSQGCDTKRHHEDHLSIVAGVTAFHRRELEARGVSTLTSLAQLPVPLPFMPKRGAVETYVRVREQARVQLESRGRPTPVHELRGFEEGKGLSRLPAPSPGDVFLDLEGDSFAREGGREYLFGVVTIDPAGSPVYRAFWALDDHEERRAFESVMDLIEESWRAHVGMHVYHYAPYEPSAFKRLMGRHATREAALDTLLRAERFVDLYGVVRQGLRAGIERYSIKCLEVLYGFERAVLLEDANRGLRTMAQALQSSGAVAVPKEIRDVVQGYNQDDCLSALRLRDWLEQLRAGLEASGTPVARPALQQGEASENVDARAQRVAALRTRLLEGVAEERIDRSDEEQARWLLAYLLDWHRREDKASWWEYFRLKDLPEDELLDEPQAIAGLEYVGRVPMPASGKATRAVVDRYRYPAQEMEVRRKDELKLKDGKKLGDVVAVNRAASTLDVRKGPSQAAAHPTAAFAHKYVNPGVLEDALYRIGESVAGAGRVTLDRSQPHRLASQLLLAAAPPRLRSGPFAAGREESMVDFAVRTAPDLDETVLAIQGPPGSGKTFSGAEMICALVARGRKVGVTATGHKVIRNLLEAVAKAASTKGVDVRLAHKQDDDGAGNGAPIAVLDKNEDALAAIRSGRANVLGGTAWLWSRPELANAVDVLFVDEAGQMSLANTLAVSGAARSLVLLGDPQQLDQPEKGSHPEGVSVSALEHILGARPTISPDRGIFLPITWRLAPALCSFTSELFYENRLTSRTGLDNQRLVGVGDLDGSGLRVVEVDHDGNRNSSAEEIEAVADLVRRLTAPGAQWINEKGEAAQMSGEHVLVVAPYNAQVSRLAERLEPTGARVGTVDRFQGQEAPVVIYSMATSRPEDAPRGMEFLYSLNRLNVATSRARCLAILVASPRLFEPECRSPRQMKLANALCRYRELARP
jgi:predicted RecB family nuclease